jgi:hypothetical protein
MGNTRIKLAALVLALVPVVFYLCASVSAVISGARVFRVMYIVIVLPLALLAVLAWRQPRNGGGLLVIAGVLFALLFLLDIRAQYPIEEVLAIEGILFIPPVIAGLLFLMAARHVSSADASSVVTREVESDHPVV